MSRRDDGALPFAEWSDADLCDLAAMVATELRRRDVAAMMEAHGTLAALEALSERAIAERRARFHVVPGGVCSAVVGP